MKSYREQILDQSKQQNVSDQEQEFRSRAEAGGEAAYQHGYIHKVMQDGREYVSLTEEGAIKALQTFTKAFGECSAEELYLKSVFLLSCMKEANG